ncbi:hypothetical protein [Actinoplanes nipponensis]|uniref:hypothetical protein n=1 Tax=Actinoplanes nipponensis TaxID=135950 RepID=UPI0031EF1D79
MGHLQRHVPAAGQDPHRVVAARLGLQLPGHRVEVGRPVAQIGHRLPHVGGERGRVQVQPPRAGAVEAGHGPVRRVGGVQPDQGGPQPLGGDPGQRAHGTDVLERQPGAFVQGEAGAGHDVLLERGTGENHPEHGRRHEHGLGGHHQGHPGDEFGEAAAAAAVPGGDEFGDAGEDREDARAPDAALHPGDRQEEVVEDERHVGQRQDHQRGAGRLRVARAEQTHDRLGGEDHHERGRQAHAEADEQAHPHLGAQRSPVAAGHREQRERHVARHHRQERQHHESGVERRVGLRRQHRGDDQWQRCPRQVGGQVEQVVVEGRPAPAAQQRQAWAYRIDRALAPQGAAEDRDRQHHPGDPGEQQLAAGQRDRQHGQHAEQGQLEHREPGVAHQLQRPLQQPDQGLVQDQGHRVQRDAEDQQHGGGRAAERVLQAGDGQVGDRDVAQAAEGRGAAGDQQAGGDQLPLAAAQRAQVGDEHGAHAEHADRADQRHRRDGRGGLADGLGGRGPRRHPPVREAEQRG